MQLIQYDSSSKENRSQEIGKITRDLKILAKNTRSPIILLSQLNRNIDNRTNKRPLLSDLRESGCISQISKPYVQKNSSGRLCVEAVTWLMRSYGFNTEERIKLGTSKAQYTYYTACHKELALYATHNHKMLINQSWHKIDQIKQKKHSRINFGKTISGKLKVGRSILQHIRLIKKENVYDLAVHEYSNFLVHKYIIHNSIEQDSDLILMLYQDSENSSDDRIDIIIAKHRNGPVGSFQLMFHADICRFTNIEEI